MSPRRRSPRSGGSASFHYRVVSPRPSFTAEDFYSLRASLSQQDSLLPVESGIEDTDSEVLELPLSFDKSPPPEPELGNPQEPANGTDLSFAAKRKAIECLNANCEDQKFINSVFARFCKKFDEWNLHRKRASVRKKGLAFVPPEELEAVNDIAIQKWSRLCDELSKWSKTDSTLDIPSVEPLNFEITPEIHESSLSLVENAILRLDLAHVQVQKSLAMTMQMEQEMNDLAQRMRDSATVDADFTH